MIGVCGGALVSSRVVLSAHHCTRRIKGTDNSPCDHSGGERHAVLGTNKFNMRDWKKGKYSNSIPIIMVMVPPNGYLRKGNKDSHDFALLVLKHPVKITPEISPICLPDMDAEFGGKNATAAGWGRTDTDSVNKKQSPVLKKVELTVSDKKYRHYKMFGTLVSKQDNMYQDPCSGDSGTVQVLHYC